MGGDVGFWIFIATLLGKVFGLTHAGSPSPAQHRPGDTMRLHLYIRSEQLMPRASTVKSFLSIAALIVAAGAGCSARSEGKLRVEAAWARATPPGASVGAVYLTIQNPGPADRLLKVTTSASERAEIHETSMADGQMQMRQIEVLEIPDDGSVTFEPGGMHLMLIGLKQALVEGDLVPFGLEFERAGTLQAQARVAGVGAMGPGESLGEDHSVH